METTIEDLFDELISAQEEKLLRCAAEIIPHATSDDILQPNDYPELESHPFFRYEEGVLKGIHAARMAVLSWKRMT